MWKIAVVCYFVGTLISTASAQNASNDTLRFNSDSGSLNIRFKPTTLELKATFTDANGNQALDAEEAGQILVTLTNQGPGKAYRPTINGQLKDSPSSISARPLSHKSGTLEPGQQVKTRMDLSATEALKNGIALFLFEATDAYGRKAQALELKLETRALVPPLLKLADVGIDDDDSGDSFGNANGKIEKGESIEVKALIQNQGQGEATAVRLIIEPPEDLFFTGKRQFNLGDLAPSDHRSIEFAFTVPPSYSGSANLNFPIKINESRPRYNQAETLQFVLNQSTKGTTAVAPKQITLQSTRTTPIEITDVPSLSVDVDTNIPQTGKEQRNAVAVVIGNQNYLHMGNVDFAERDAAIIKEYLIQSLGYDPSHIFYATDATKTTFETYFGSSTDHRSQLFNQVREGAEVFIYYSGHGHSAGPDQPSYFVPADAQVAAIQLAGYPLEVFYQNLTKLMTEKKPNSLTVVIESCFSGYLAEELGISSTRWVADNPLLSLKNSGAVVMTAASERQTAKWYKDKRHGLFTYFLLKSLQNSPNANDQKADADNDGKLTLAEIQRFIHDPNYGVPYWAYRLTNEQQTPVIVGNADAVLIEW